MIRPVRDRRTFVALRTDGVRVRRGPLSVVHLAEPGSSDTRLAFAITKRVGGAVERNRLRRRLRAIVATLAADPAGPVPRGVLLVSAGPDAAHRNPEELRNDVESLLSALASRLDGRDGS